MKSKNYSECVRILTQIAEEYPDYSEIIHVYSNRGYIYLELGENEKAIEDFTKVIEMDANFKYIHDYRSTAYMRIKEYDKAISDCEMTIKETPEVGYNNRGLTYYFLKDYSKALIDFTESMNLKPESNTLNNRANVYIKLQDYSNALKDLSKALDLNPNFSSKSYERSCLLLHERI